MELANLLAASVLAASLQLSNEVTSDLMSAPAPVHVQAPTSGLVLTGQSAPDFVFRSHEYGWRRLRDVLAQGSVLLVFGGTDSQLRSVQNSYRPLLESGVVPMVVTALPSSEARRAIERCEVSFSLLSDPQDEIATQFGVAGPVFQGWYLIDSKGRVRGHGTGELPSQDWTRLATAAFQDEGTQALSDE